MALRGQNARYLPENSNQNFVCYPIISQQILAVSFVESVGGKNKNVKVVRFSKEKVDDLKKKIADSDRRSWKWPLSVHIQSQTKHTSWT